MAKMKVYEDYIGIRNNDEISVNVELRVPEDDLRLAIQDLFDQNQIQHYAKQERMIQELRTIQKHN